jgi:hypothetical protein
VGVTVEAASLLCGDRRNGYLLAERPGTVAAQAKPPTDPPMVCLLVASLDPHAGVRRVH